VRAGGGRVVGEERKRGRGEQKREKKEAFFLVFCFGGVAFFFSLHLSHRGGEFSFVCACARMQEEEAKIYIEKQWGLNKRTNK
jgi:3-oxoacyl-(acyl-carrier-protein) synthase